MKTIVKANYIKASQNGLAKIKNSARYYIHRPNMEQERHQRLAFTQDQNAIDRQEAFETLDQAERDKVAYYYRMVISPGAPSEVDEDVQAWTREIMHHLQEKHQRHLTWLAVEHTNEASHTEHAHVHVIVGTYRTIRKNELRDLRAEATQSWQLQKEYQQDVTHDYLHEYTKTQEHSLEREY